MQSQCSAPLTDWQVGVVLGVCVLVGAVGGFWLGVGVSAWYAPAATAEPELFIGPGIITPGPGGPFDYRITPPPTKSPQVGTLI